MPIVVDPGILARHQKKARLRRLGPVGRRHHGGEKVPLRIVAAAGEAPDSGGPIAAVDRHRLADRRIGPRRDGAGVGPEFVLCLFGKACHEPLMHGAEAVNPGRGPAAPADRGDQFGENIEAVFETAISRGCRMRNSSASRMRSMTSSAMHRFASVSCARARTISAMARARDSNSGTSGLSGDERMAVTDMFVLPSILGPLLITDRWCSKKTVTAYQADARIQHRWIGAASAKGGILRVGVRSGTRDEFWIRQAKQSQSA